MALLLQPWGDRVAEAASMPTICHELLIRSQIYCEDKSHYMPTNFMGAAQLTPK